MSDKTKARIAELRARASELKKTTKLKDMTKAKADRIDALINQANALERKINQSTDSQN